MTGRTQLSIHHTALVVADLERSRAFYEQWFGGQVEHVIPDMDDPSVAALHQLEDAKFTLMFVSFGQTRLELIEFERPAERNVLHGVSNDIELRHLAFACPDVHGLYSEMVAAGVSFTQPPYTVAGGTVLAFCFDPDGTRVEILQAPDGH